MRFIPTRVGNTADVAAAAAIDSVHPHARGEHVTGTRLVAPCSAVHPHARGEHKTPDICALVQGGSSPRAWGTLRPARSARVLNRFIPTRVGNTPSLKTSLTARTVHPHARGEHRSDPNAALSQPGSSPRAWGTQDIHVAPALEHRFIPTRVGNTAFIC